MRFSLGVGYLRLDTDTPRLESRGLFVGEGEGRSWTAGLEKKLDPIGLGLTYTFVPLEQTTVRIVDDPRSSGPAYKTPMRVHLIRLQIHRQFVSARWMQVSVEGGGGFVYINPGVNRPLPGSASMNPELQEFGSTFDPVLSVGARLRIPIRDRFGVTAGFRDNLQFCDGSHDNEGVGRYLCTHGAGLNHYEFLLGADIGW